MTMTRRAALGAIASIPAVGGTAALVVIPAPRANASPTRQEPFSIEERLSFLPPETAQRIRTTIQGILDQVLEMIERGESSEAIAAYAKGAFALRRAG
ncbi:hypothetical protein [Mesorhizobium sp. M4B.F.Ca.ET.013.02.1.1]|uniref:hypothetical protein n=1 Tax=Mesorhizobium sp. M4B.F.Ca.ET.013.02.1.1 TaxID=2496755 RepID=UPI000FD2E0DB|nr:hypothetical protein [Mesorhizobium sp. M4B.F.Ca.ET.013.02.1.1]RUW26948.1 hypothetical protein EOA34_06600 [Mesorhizobium sp. M4B.F.Ca.ET.013.02.1.1]